MNTPLAITIDEWKEIIALPQVQQMWELDDTDTVESFASSIYGVKFNYTPKPQHDKGDLYIISNGDASGCNMIIKRVGMMLIADE